MVLSGTWECWSLVNHNSVVVCVRLAVTALYITWECWSLSTIIVWSCVLGLQWWYSLWLWYLSTIMMWSCVTVCQGCNDGIILCHMGIVVSVNHNDMIVCHSVSGLQWWYYSLSYGNCGLLSTIMMWLCVTVCRGCSAGILCHMGIVVSVNHDDVIVCHSVLWLQWSYSLSHGNCGVHQPYKWCGRVCSGASLVTVFVDECKFV